MLGQQNPWNHILKNLKKVDCVLHIGDQIYPDNEDIAHAGGLFGKLFDGLVTSLGTRTSTAIALGLAPA